MDNVVLIIGNGFDLDLKLKTKYIDFANSELWPFDLGCTEFAEFLNKSKSDKTWFDLEQLIGEYACGFHLYGDTIKKHFRTTTKVDIEDYQVLCEKLALYLQNAQKSEIDIQSTAAQVLHKVLQMSFSDSYNIYSFNYTDLNLIARKIGCNDNFTCHHIHGSLKDNNIILGCGDGENISHGYEFMRKSFNKNYNPPKILFDLLTRETIIFFGLSFGSIDYAYFNLFFDTIANVEEVHKGYFKSKNIHIFTYDEKSRMEILHNIHERTNKRLSQISVINNLTFYRTNETEDKEKIAKFLSKD
ncbi:MAG: bacteriophage abortive infection AbiH family protein [Paludibacteraceae bacterium]|nr:bacteriophage abortive infection AbiH family protein [Paludibacteraceae bacterium]